MMITVYLITFTVIIAVKHWFLPEQSLHFSYGQTDVSNVSEKEPEQLATQSCSYI